MTANQINFAKLQEDKRHNLISEQELQRHNVADEAIREESNRISYYNTQVTQEHYQRQDSINEEHYGRMDAETARSHIAQENETQRTNREHEDIEWANYGEKVRHDKAEENIEVAKVLVSNKSADAAVSQAESAAKNANTNAVNATTNAKNAETNRMNAETNRYAAQKEAQYHQVMATVSQLELEEKQRHNQVVEKETERHNKEVETNQWNANQINFVNTPTGSTKSTEIKSNIYRNKAQATEYLARAGYLRTQADWYAWEKTTAGIKNIGDAVNSFVGAGAKGAAAIIGLGG